jgi:hypothetical protein
MSPLAALFTEADFYPLGKNFRKKIAHDNLGIIRKS